MVRIICSGFHFIQVVNIKLRNIQGVSLCLVFIAQLVSLAADKFKSGEQESVFKRPAGSAGGRGIYWQGKLISREQYWVMLTPVPEKRC